jgi:hypothetical protein
MVLTNEKLEEIRMGLQISPWKSVRQLSQKTGVSVGSASNATELMKFFSYRMRVMHEHNLQMLHRGYGFNWMLKDEHSGLVDLQLLFITDAYFHISHSVNFLNTNLE